MAGISFLGKGVGTRKRLGTTVPVRGGVERASVRACLCVCVCDGGEREIHYFYLLVSKHVQIWLVTYIAANYVQVIQFVLSKARYN